MRLIQILFQPMVEFLRLVSHSGGSLFKSRARLEAENMVLRHLLNVLRRKAPKRLRPTSADRLPFVWLCRFLPPVGRRPIVLRHPPTVLWHAMTSRLLKKSFSTACFSPGNRNQIATSMSQKSTRRGNLGHSLGRRFLRTGRSSEYRYDRKWGLVEQFAGPSLHGTPVALLTPARKVSA